MVNALVVDDEEDICDFLKGELEEFQFEVFTALTGEKAIYLADEKRIDFSIVDLRLSTAVTGLEVIRYLQKKWPGTVVAAMSGYVDIGLRQETGKLGVHTYFVKPDDVQPSVFRQKIQALLEKRR